MYFVYFVYFVYSVYYVYSVSLYNSADAKYTKYTKHTKYAKYTCFAPRESKFTKSPWTSRTCDGLGTDPPSTHHTPSTSPRLRTKCLKYLKYRVR